MSTTNSLPVASNDAEAPAASPITNRPAITVFTGLQVQYHDVYGDAAPSTDNMTGDAALKALIWKFLHPPRGALAHMRGANDNPSESRIMITLEYAVNVLGEENFVEIPGRRYARGDETFPKMFLRDDIDFGAKVIAMGIPHEIILWLADKNGPNEFVMKVDDFKDTRAD